MVFLSLSLLLLSSHLAQSMLFQNFQQLGSWLNYNITAPSPPITAPYPPITAPYPPITAPYPSATSSSKAPPMELEEQEPYILPFEHFRSHSYSSSLRRPTQFRRTPNQVASPLTKSMCQTPIYQALRSCKFARAETSAFANEKRQILDKYLCWKKDKWDFQVKKRHSRKKRSGNECKGVSTQTTVLLAREAMRPWIWRELLHDPENHLYQTIYAQQCDGFGPYGIMHCRMHDMKFKAAVWSLTSSDGVDVLNVITEGYCALTSV